MKKTLIAGLSALALLGTPSYVGQFPLSTEEIRESIEQDVPKALKSEQGVYISLYRTLLEMSNSSQFSSAEYIQLLSVMDLNFHQHLDKRIIEGMDDKRTLDSVIKEVSDFDLVRKSLNERLSRNIGDDELLAAVNRDLLANNLYKIQLASTLRIEIPLVSDNYYRALSCLTYHVRQGLSYFGQTGPVMPLVQIAYNMPALEAGWEKQYFKNIDNLLPYFEESVKEAPTAFERIIHKRDFEFFKDVTDITFDILLSKDTKTDIGLLKNKMDHLLEYHKGEIPV